MEREHGELTYRLTQLLSGHGCFQEYLWKIGKAGSPKCLMCDLHENDTAAHTMLRCRRFEGQRQRLHEHLQVQDITADNLVPLMLRGEEEWMAVLSFAETTIREKEREEQEREQRRRMADRTRGRGNHSPEQQEDEAR